MHLTQAQRKFLLYRTDPSVQHKVLTTLLGRRPTDPAVRRARAKIGHEGWAAQILRYQLADGQWTTPHPRHHYLPKYIATNWRLIVLAELGMTRRHPRIARAVQGVMAWEGRPRGGLGGRSSEVCYTGNAVRMLTLFGYLDHPLTQASIDWLVRHQKPDGGWNCYPVRTGTLDGWEALNAFAVIPEDQRSPGVRRAIERGAEFYLKRRLLREGSKPYLPWRRLHFPTHYYYDGLVGLDMLTRLGYVDDRRMDEALDWLLSLQSPNGTWNVDAQHPDLPMEEEYQPRTPYYPFVLEPAGRPGRWVTATALSVLGRTGRA